MKFVISQFGNVGKCPYLNNIFEIFVFILQVILDGNAEGTATCQSLPYTPRLSKHGE